MLPPAGRSGNYPKPILRALMLARTLQACYALALRKAVAQGLHIGGLAVFAVQRVRVAQVEAPAVAGPVCKAVVQLADSTARVVQAVEHTLDPRAPEDLRHLGLAALGVAVARARVVAVGADCPNDQPRLAATLPQRCLHSSPVRKSCDTDRCWDCRPGSCWCRNRYGSCRNCSSPSSSTARFSAGS